MKRDLGLDEPELGGHRTSTLTKRLAHSTEEDSPERRHANAGRGPCADIASRIRDHAPLEADRRRPGPRRIWTRRQRRPAALPATGGPERPDRPDRRRHAGAGRSRERGHGPDRPQAVAQAEVAQPPARETSLMAVLAWGMMGLAIWHFTIWLPDRFWGGIVGALIGALIGAVLFGVDHPRVLSAVATRHRSVDRARGDSGNADRPRGGLVRGRPARARDGRRARDGLTPRRQPETVPILRRRATT